MANDTILTVNVRIAAAMWLSPDAEVADLGQRIARFLEADRAAVSVNFTQAETPVEFGLVARHLEQAHGLLIPGVTC